MNDRELLEAAAKANGLVIDSLRQQERDAEINPAGAGLWIKNGKTWWHPLDDSADAFALMVRLRLDVCRPHKKHDAVCVWVDTLRDFIEEPDGTDPEAATRRAIVRAAAAMGGAA